MYGTSTVAELLSDARRLLDSDSARLDAEILLAHALHTDRAYLYAHPRHAVAAGPAADFRACVARRAKQYPVAYLTGEREFWSLALTVSGDTLIPRPETELVVEAALELIPPGTRLRVLDLGTGSGAIAIALARERPDCAFTATDISSRALAVAAANAARHGVARLRLLCSDWLAGVAGEHFDLIVCNPPYVDSRDALLVDTEIRHEPRLALDGGQYGLQCLNRIIPAACRNLAPGGCLILEHGAGQGAAVRELLLANRYTGVATRCDLAGHERISLGRYP